MTQVRRELTRQEIAELDDPARPLARHVEAVVVIDFDEYYARSRRYEVQVKGMAGYARCFAVDLWETGPDTCRMQVLWCVPLGQRDRALEDWSHDHGMLALGSRSAAP